MGSGGERPTANRAGSGRTERRTGTPRRPNREIELVACIKGEQETERVHKMSAAEVVALAPDSDTVETLAARKDIQGVSRFKGMIVFRIGKEGSKTIVESNDFRVKEVSTATVLRRERAGVVVHGIRVNSMPMDMKKEGAKTTERSCKTMHQGLKIEEVAWLTKESDKKDYASIVM